MNDYWGDEIQKDDVLAFSDGSRMIQVRVVKLFCNGVDVIHEGGTPDMFFIEDTEESTIIKARV